MACFLFCVRIPEPMLYTIYIYVTHTTYIGWMAIYYSHSIVFVYFVCKFILEFACIAPWTLCEVKAYRYTDTTSTHVGILYCIHNMRNYPAYHRITLYVEGNFCRRILKLVSALNYSVQCCISQMWNFPSFALSTSVYYTLIQYTLYRLYYTELELLVH